MCDILVIAQFHENLAWIESAASETREMRIVRYTKESGNYGRESASYIRFIAEHYRDTRTANDTLVCFSQGSIRGPQTQMTSLSLPPRKSAPYTPLFNSIRVRFDSCGRPHDRLRRINPNTKQTKQKKQHRVSRRGECKRAGSAGSANGRR